MKIHHHQQLKKPKTKHQDITRHQDFEPAICSMSPAKASGRSSQQAPLVNWFQLSSGILKVLDHFFHNSYICTLASAWQLHVYHPPTPRLFFWSLQHSVLRLLVGIYIYNISIYTVCIVILCFLRASASASLCGWLQLSPTVLHTLFMQKVRAFNTLAHGLCADKDKRATEKTETHRHANGVCRSWELFWQLGQWHPHFLDLSHYVSRCGNLWWLL